MSKKRIIAAVAASLLAATTVQAGWYSSKSSDRYKKKYTIAAEITDRCASTSTLIALCNGPAPSFAEIAGPDDLPVLCDAAALALAKAKSFIVGHAEFGSSPGYSRSEEVWLEASFQQAAIVATNATALTHVDVTAEAAAQVLVDDAVRDLSDGGVCDTFRDEGAWCSFAPAQAYARGSGSARAFALASGTGYGVSELEGSTSAYLRGKGIYKFEAALRLQARVESQALSEADTRSVAEAFALALASACVEAEVHAAATDTLIPTVCSGSGQAAEATAAAAGEQFASADAAARADSAIAVDLRVLYKKDRWARKPTLEILPGVATSSECRSDVAVTTDLPPSS